MAAGQEVEGPILATVGRLKLVPQTKLPLVLQLQPDDGLTQWTSVLADHTEGGAWGQNQGYPSGSEKYSHRLNVFVHISILQPHTCKSVKIAVVHLKWHPVVKIF